MWAVPTNDPEFLSEGDEKSTLAELQELAALARKKRGVDRHDTLKIHAAAMVSGGIPERARAGSMKHRGVNSSLPKLRKR